MAKAFRTFSTSDRYAGNQNVEKHYSAGTVGNVTSAPSSTNFVCKRAGKITGATLSMTMGVDASNPLSLSYQLTNTNTGNTIFSTVPSIAKAAGNVFATVNEGSAAATGIVPPVFTAANQTVSAGDVIKIVWTLTRTASPGTEIADASCCVTLSELSDFDPTTA